MENIAQIEMSDYLASVSATDNTISTENCAVNTELMRCVDVLIRELREKQIYCDRYQIEH